MDDLLIKIEDNQYEASFRKCQSSQIRINEKLINIENLEHIKDNLLSVSINNKSYEVELNFNSNGKPNIFIDGISLDASITDETENILYKHIKEASADSDSSTLKIKAAMPGLVVKILVNEGDKVKKDDSIIVLEAMKMENALKAPQAGVVKKINVKEGDTVEKNMLLLELE